MRLLWLLFAFLVVKSSGTKDSVKNQPSSSPQLTENDYGVVNQDETAQNLDNKCGAAITGLKAGDNGVIESPGYPQGYPSNADCEWSVKAQEGHLIQVTFFDVRTQKPEVPFGEAHDYLDVSLSGDRSETQRYSGDLNAITPFTLITDGPDLYLRFKSESSHDPGYTGFRIVYYVSNNTGVSALLPPKGAIAASCKYEPKDSPIELPAADEINLDDIPALSRKYDQTLQKEFMELKEINRTNPHPYLVALVLDDEQFCSGTLVRNDYVVTTAHCASNVDKVDLIFGTDDISKEDAGVQRQTVSRSNIITHPYFSESTGSNDIALIKLNDPIKTTRFVKAIRLPSWNTLGNVFSGHGVKVVGWGNSSEGSIFSKSRSKDLIISPNAACRASYFKGLTGMMMCSKQETRRSLCQADLGSPVTTKCLEDTKYYGRRKHQNRMHHLYSDVSSLSGHSARRRTMKNTDRASGPGSAFAPPQGAGGIPGSEGFKPPSSEIGDSFTPGNPPAIPGQSQGSGFIPGVPGSPGSCYRLINNPLSKPQQTSSPPVVNVYGKPNGKPNKPTATTTTTTEKSQRPQKPHGKPNKPHGKPKPEVSDQVTNNNRPSKPSASKPAKPATDNNNNVKPPNNKPNRPTTSAPAIEQQQNNRPTGRPSKPASGQGQRPNRPQAGQGQRPNRPQAGQSQRPNRPAGQGQGRPPNQGKPGQSQSGGGGGQSNGIGGCQGFQRSPNVLLGIVSFGSCQRGFVFTRITAYMDFLSENMGPWYE